MPDRTYDEDGGVGLEGTRGLHRFSHEAMATVFEVYVAHEDGRYAAQAAHAAFDLVDRLEQELSRFIANSDISRINGLTPGAGTRVSATTMECLLIARHMYDVTGGAFDVAIGTGLPSLVLEADTCVVRATAPGIRIDLGGIGKGYAVDQMADVLEEWGLDRALVHGGFSSVLALDAPQQPGWPLTLSDPAAPASILERLSLTQTALGASGRRKGDHIVDPRTGSPVRERLAAWVALPRPSRQASDGGDDSGPRPAAAGVADALTTACLLLDTEDIETLCANEPGLRVWVLMSEAAARAGAGPLRRFGNTP